VQLIHVDPIVSKRALWVIRGGIRDRDDDRKIDGDRQMQEMVQSGEFSQPCSILDDRDLLLLVVGLTGYGACGHIFVGATVTARAGESNDLDICCKSPS